MPATFSVIDLDVNRPAAFRDRHKRLPGLQLPVLGALVRKVQVIFSNEMQRVRHLRRVCKFANSTSLEKGRLPSSLLPTSTSSCLPRGCSLYWGSCTMLPLP